MKNVFNPKSLATWSVTYWMPPNSIEHELILKVERETAIAVGSHILDGLKIRYWENWEPQG